ncbi:MAG: DUF1294 domain-containing protein [Clostridia bacterium]|nr:DUF1294 domain-containing protein [Clostridia bacterium]
MPISCTWATAYLAVVSLLAIIVTVHDKRAAKKRRRRVPEKTLLLLGALGGAAAMLVTMLLIRHKTRKLKFMIGLPLIILLQAAAVTVGYWYHWIVFI